MDLSESSFRTGKTVILRIGGQLFVCHFHQNEKIQIARPKMHNSLIYNKCFQININGYSSIKRAVIFKDFYESAVC